MKFSTKNNSIFKKIDIKFKLIILVTIKLNNN